MKKRPKSRKDAENMISLPLKFDEVESVEEFVNMVKRLDYDVDVKIGQWKRQWMVVLLGNA